MMFLVYLLRVREANEVPSSREGSLENIQTALNPFKKIEINLYSHFRIAYSMKTMNRPDPT